MKVGIVGFGFVGKALKNGLKDNVDCLEIDPILGTDLNDLKSHEPSIVFICLPTPMNDDGSQNIDLVKDAVNQINKFEQDILLVIKSTILPKYVDEILTNNNNIIINPEFLRENFANEDLSKLILSGCISLILIQTFIHVGVNIRILPTTGMTLPFLSYGGSSIVSTAILSGLILNLTKRKLD